MYNHNAVIRPKRKLLSPEALNVLEQKYNFVFPEDIRRHYLHYNGGTLKKCIFRSRGLEVIVSELLPIGPYSDSSLESYYQDLNLERHILPKHLVTFAIDPGGDFICFSVKLGEVGAIYIYRTEYHGNSKKAARYLAPSLRDFIEKMALDV